MTVQSQRTDAWLAPVLVRRGVLTRDQGEEIGRAAAGIWRGALERSWATDEQIVSAVAMALRLPVADLAKADARIAELIPEKTARRYVVLPIQANDRTIRVATADPRDYDVEQNLRFVSGREVEFEVAAPAVITARLDELYRPERSIERILNGLQPASVEAVEDTAPPTDRDRALDAPVAKLVDAMISDGVREGASDIHAEPVDGAVVVRYRNDGVLREVMRLPEVAGGALVRRVKVWAIERVQQGGIDLVVLDFEMPRLDGLGVLEELRAQMRTAALPVIMLTCHTGDTEEKALDLGAQDYLTKPVQTRSLVARVKAVLKRAHS